MRHGAFQYKGIEVERPHFLPLAQYADIAVAAALGIDAARLVEEGEDGIGGRARIVAGAGHEAGHEDRDGLGVHRADIHLHIDHARRVELALDGLVQRLLGVDGQARHRHAPDVGNGDHALRIDGQDVVHRAPAPQTHDQAVAALDDLAGGTLGKVPLKEVGSKWSGFGCRSRGRSRGRSCGGRRRRGAGGCGISRRRRQGKRHSQQAAKEKQLVTAGKQGVPPQG